MFEVDLTSQVPQYPNDQPNWGGAACCQMAMDGYPPGSSGSYISQATIWNYIQAHNQEPGYSPSSWDYGWYADPYAVTKALNDLCPPQYHWIDNSGTDKETVLYTLLVWMANYQYPSLLCTWAHDYWAVLVYYRTSDDPRAVNHPTLEKVGLYEPSTSGVPYKEIDGASWMNGPYYWGLPCDQTNSAGESMCGQKWNNKWVGIGEPPQVEGSVRVESITRVGEKLISPVDATRISRKVLAEQLRTKSVFLRGSLSDAQALTPMLVRELPMGTEGQKAQPSIHFYIIPFAQKYDIAKTGARLAKFSIYVNAYTGRFEQLAIYPIPVHFLSEKDVIQIVARDLSLGRQEVGKIKAELIFRPLRMSISNNLPVWRVHWQHFTFDVTQTGQIISTMLYPDLRGA